MTVDGDNYGFEVVVPKSAGPLAPGEKYVVSYQVNNIQTTDKSADGYAKLGNYAGVYNGNVKNATATDIEIQARQILKIKEKMNEIIAKRTGQPLEKVKQDTERDYYMSAEEAREYGLIDGIIPARR